MAPSRSAASSLTAYSITFSLLCTLLNGDTLASSIGCFVCSSFNGSDKNCEDTFNSSVINYDDPAVVYYQFPCWGYRKNRVGLFPADHCIKISGYKTENNSETMVIRTCALDSGTLTADTDEQGAISEIVRISHCGQFKYDGHEYKGCVQACDTNGCNAGTSLLPNSSPLLLSLISILSLGILLLR